MHRHVLIALLMVASAFARPGETRELLVCADPNNLPFSNAARQGYENRIVELVAQALGATVKYEWWAQRRGNIRETLRTRKCDVIPGVPSNLEMLATTRPYYRSTYVFLTRTRRHLDLTSLDDERLHTLTIGVQMIGDDFSNTPPAHALAKRGIVDNVRGYMVYGNYAQEAPSRTIVEAVANGEIDVAIVWGPLAGYFSGRSREPLTLKPVTPLLDGAMLPMTFEISMGVRKSDRALLEELNGVLERRRGEIENILEEYEVPLIQVRKAHL